VEGPISRATSIANVRALRGEWAAFAARGQSNGEKGVPVASHMASCPPTWPQRGLADTRLVPPVEVLKLTAPPVINEASSNLSPLPTSAMTRQYHCQLQTARQVPSPVHPG